MKQYAIERVIELIKQNDKTNAINVLDCNYNLGYTNCVKFIDVLTDALQANEPKFHGFIVTAITKSSGGDWLQSFETHDEAMTRARELCADNEHICIKVSGILEVAQQKTITIQTFD